MKIGFFGSGIFASSLAYAINKNKENEIFMYDKFSFHKTDLNAEYTKDINSFFSNKFDFVFIGVPSSVFIEAIKDIPNEYNANFTICTKGISDSENLFFSDILFEHLKHHKICVLSGPNFAIEILNQTETITTIASKDLKYAKQVADIFKDSCIEVECSNKIYQAQIFGALKNVMAIYIGYMYGKGYGMNHIMKYTMETLKESFLLASKFENTIDMLSSCVIGDIILTCFNEKSRNRSFGEAISKGSGREFLNNNTVEGYKNAFSVDKLIKKYNLKLSNFEKVIKLISEV